MTSVLIVEDERIIAKALEKRLGVLGYAVAGVAANGEDGVNEAIGLRPDIVLMDITLGSGIDGTEAAERIRKLADIPIVYLTANSDPVTFDRAKQTGAFGYVLKPCENKDLQSAIEIGLYRHRMERQIRENEQWLAATLGSIGDGVIATDPLGRVLFLNSLAEQMTGWPQAQAVGKDMREVFHILHEKSRKSIPNPAIEAVERGEIVTLPNYTILVARDGAERPIEDCASPIRDVDGAITGSVLVFRDISERRRLEEHLRQVEKIAAIGQLASGIAHDFNNIMTVITAYSEMLRVNVALPPADRDKYLELIIDASARAAELTQQILAFSRLQILVPAILSLNTCVHDIGAMVRRLIGENIAFVTEVDPALGQVKADPTQLGQVILNLVVNARDAMPTGGRLLVATANVELNERFPLAHSGVPQGRYVMLSVSDTGIGMSPEVMSHVFEPFFTTKQIGQGTGLGLATVYGIVKQSGGHIEVESTVGLGTTFRVYLPRIEEPPVPDGGSSSPHALRGTETVLLVEDEEAVRQVTKLILEQHGYSVLVASDGSQGIEVSRNYSGTIHLVLTDLMMPNISGRMLAESIMATRPGVRVLFMSGYTDDILVRQEVGSSAADFLQKPFTLEVLRRKVREILDRP